MGNPLLQKLKENSKGSFGNHLSSISYSTGFRTFDYRNGYLVTVEDEKGEVIDRYSQLGIGNGNIVTVVGETQTGKTTFFVQAAYNIVKPFKNGFVRHYDLEKTFNLTRLKNLLGMTREEYDSKYSIEQNICYMEDILNDIIDIAHEKINNKKEYLYDTGKLDDYGNPIIMMEPTVVIIDSLPALTVKKNADTMEGLTGGGRNAIMISEFYSKIVPYANAANIIFFIVNHLKDIPQLNAFSAKKPSIPYMKANKNIPGGKAALLFSHVICYFEVISKYNYEDNGFDGFCDRVSFWKTRSNKAGKTCQLVFNQETGFDPVLSLYEYAKENNLIEGRNPKKYFVNQKENATFDDRILISELKQKPEIARALVRSSIELLNSTLSTIDRSELDKLTEQLKNVELEDKNTEE